MPAETGGHTPRGSTLSTAVTAGLLGLGTLILYQPSLHHGFINYDDNYYVTANLHVLRGLSWSNLVWAMRTITYGNWHPLTWMSHMAEVQLFGLNPAGFHFVSMLVHTLNVVLIFLLLRAATGFHWRSAAVAALFAVHPLNVEAVAWVAEFKSLLCTTFLLLIVWAYREYVRKPGIGHYLLVAALFALGLMAKPMVVTLPVLLLCLDYWPLQRLPVPGKGGPGFLSAFLRLAAEKVPLFLLSAGSAAITLYAQRDIGALGTTLALPLRWRLGNAIYSYFAYLWKGFWPARLAVFYPHPESSLAAWKVGLAAAVLLAITILVWRNRQRRYLLAGWTWYLVALLPVIGVVQVGRQAMADRYAYIPFLGLFAIIVWLAAEAAPRLHAPRAVEVAAAVAIVFAFAWAANRQLAYWEDSYTLFSHALEVTTDNSIAEDNLGTALVAMGRTQEAMTHFDAAARLQPRDFEPRYNRATLLLRAGLFPQAEHEYQVALANALDPLDAAHAHNNLGVLYLQTNRPAAALAEFDTAIHLDPNQHNSLLARGTLEYEAGKLDAALADISRAAQLAPSSIAYFWLGQTMEAKGDLPSAARAYQAALQMTPSMAEAQTRLNAVRARLQK
ncbi:MAG TPA: tetratricopeptide repeat protein [Terriglobales bacterium]|nr:tetratricopeptide repeat protein [Terriglobales bacterium]